MIKILKIMYKLKIIKIKKWIYMIINMYILKIKEIEIY